MTNLNNASVATSSSSNAASSSIALVNNQGNHPVVIIAGAVYDPNDRKYHGGQVVATIPYSGMMLSANINPQPLTPISVGGVDIPVESREYTSIDPLPEDGATHIVSAIYAAAMQHLARNERAARDAAGITGPGQYESWLSRILTIGDPVIDADEKTGRTVIRGCCRLVAWTI